MSSTARQPPKNLSCPPSGALTENAVSEPPVSYNSQPKSEIYSKSSLLLYSLSKLS